jgi:hypothetical protein
MRKQRQNNNSKLLTFGFLAAVVVSMVFVAISSGRIKTALAQGPVVNVLIGSAPDIKPVEPEVTKELSKLALSLLNLPYQSCSNCSSKSN